MKVTLFMLLRASGGWLKLSRETRRELSSEAIALAFQTGGTRYRFFDAEAFNAQYSDVLMLEADTMEDAYFTVERLRDTPLIYQGYFEVREIIPAFENGHVQFEAESAVSPQ